MEENEKDVGAYIDKVVQSAWVKEQCWHHADKVVKGVQELCSHLEYQLRFLYRMSHFSCPMGHGLMVTCRGINDSDLGSIPEAIE